MRLVPSKSKHWLFCVHTRAGMSAVRSESEKKITLFFSSLEWGPQVKRKSKTALIDQIFSELAGQVALWNHVWPFESSFLALSMMYHSIPRKFRLDRPGPSDDDDDDDDGTSSHISAPVWGRSFPHWRRPQHLDCKFVSLEISNQNIGPPCCLSFYCVEL